MKPNLTFLCFLLLVCPSFAKDKKPNVVMLLSDDLGWKDIGCYGGPVKTPVLDKLAAEGVRFTDFHSGAPVCSPSRATFLTGRSHIRAGVYSVINEQVHRMHLLASETTLAEVLKDAGYATAHFGKWHLGMPNNKRKTPTPTEHGFDYWFGLVNGAHPSHKDPTNFLRNGKPVGKMKGYSCQIVVDDAINWLETKPESDEPFFLNIWFNEPHAVVAAPDELVSQYGALNDQAAIYSGTVANTDRAIGRLLAKLKKLGELDNTIIHYSSDNGSYRRDRVGKLRGSKGSHFEGGHRVPGIFYWKDGIPGGRVEEEPAGAVDLLPTICGLAGIDHPKQKPLDGSDLTPLLTRSGKFERRQPLFWMNGTTMALRMGDYTLLAPGTTKLPYDSVTINRLLNQTKAALGDDLEKELGGLDLRSRMFNGKFANPEADRLRNQFRAMFYFNEAAIPLMKKGSVNQVELYNLANDLSQKTDISAEKPEIVARMKKQANTIYQSVMGDGTEWITPEELAAAKKSQGNAPQPAAVGTSSSKTADLLARIDKNPLPDGYQGSRHQPYVDRIMAGLKPEQRARVGQLWKEKRRLDPDMPNPGASFVRILTHVAEGAGEADPAGNPSGAKTPARNSSGQKVRPSHEPKVSAASTANTSQKRPNVVVLLADDLGYRDIGCYGGPVKTPTLDELAAKGVRFTDFYAGAAVCGPSRAVLLTGRHHARAGIYGNVIFDSLQKPHLLRREVTLPEVLKKHGYGTAHFGKWHLGMPTGDVKKPTPAEHGFDYWFGMNSGAQPSHKDPVNFLRNGKPVGKMEGYSCQIVVDEAISWLDDNRDPEAPFFLNLWFHEPHDRVAAPDSIVSQYGDGNDQAAVYSGTIDNTDRAIARLLDKLKEVDSLENTLIFYTSDNGSYRDDRNGNLRGRKGSNFEGGIRVPGILCWPGTIKGGQVEHEPAGVVDLLPTVCGLLGIDKPEGVHLDGSDISPLLTGRNNAFARHQPLYWHLPSNNPSLAIRDGNYSMVAYRDYEFPRDRQAIKKVEKQIEEVLRKANSTELVPWVERTDFFYKKFKNRDAERLRGEFMRLNVFQDSWIRVLKSGSYHRFQLFDLVADPTQKVDVSKQYPEVFSRLKRQLLKINASVMAEAPDWNRQ